ncbi:MAG: hypothetical protein SP4CHLAM5_00970 [Chlamydiia bacterium]|nr:hypothetical protein [Chlamydiia bacterium]MCH9617973.1 hypothetical protein [Chlamydiia bacterium]MCH9623702.1 hypothetical protein [Chlamydiia bacterium]
MKIFKKLFILATVFMLCTESALIASEKIQPNSFIEYDLYSAISEGNLDKMGALIETYAFSPKVLGEFYLLLLSSENISKQDILENISVLKNEGAELFAETEMTLNWDHFIDNFDADMYEALQGIKGYEKFIHFVYLNVKSFVEYEQKNPCVKSIDFLNESLEFFKKIDAFLIRKKISFSKKEMGPFIEENYHLWREAPSFLVSDILEHVSPKINAELFYRYMCCTPGFMLHLLETNECQKYCMLIAPFFLGEFPKHVTAKALLLWIIEDMGKADDMSGYYLQEESARQVGRVGDYYFILQSAGMKAYLDKELETLDDNVKQKVLEIFRLGPKEWIDNEMQELLHDIEEANKLTKDMK